MNEELKQTFQAILNKSFEEKVQMGIKFANFMHDAFKAYGFSDEDTLSLFLSYTKLFVSVDRSCEQKEYELFCHIVGQAVDTQQFFEVTNHGADEDFVKEMVNLTSKFDHDTKLAICGYGTIMLTIDETMTVAEQQFMEKLINC